MDTDSAIATPDDQTIVFHLKQPFAGFDYLAQLPQTMPVPQGQGHRREVQATRSSPPVRTSSRTCSPARASSWSATTSGTRRPTRTARRCRTAYEVPLNVNADDIDNRIIAGDLDLDIAGTGVQPAALGRVLDDPDAQGERRTTRRSRGSGTPRSTRR